MVVWPAPPPPPAPPLHAAPTSAIRSPKTTVIEDLEIARCRFLSLMQSHLFLNSLSQPDDNVVKRQRCLYITDLFRLQLENSNLARHPNGLKRGDSRCHRRTRTDLDARCGRSQHRPRSASRRFRGS